MIERFPTMSILLVVVQLFASVAGFTPRDWGESRARARELLAKMDLGEKASLMRGIGWHGGTFSGFMMKWWYVGNTPQISRLGVPSLNLQDAAAGFHPEWKQQFGTVTCWPSLLAVAATWDEELVLRFGVALGEEFSGKGANGLLGPSINVHRVARGGRNFEYLSGEDPYLGARLVRKYVEGVQSMRVFTVVKHFALNQQETHRTTESSSADLKTRWELYYPPFQAAVDAGSSAAMCSYNRVDGLHACSNRALLTDDLKGPTGLNFQGMVQSDWWATHATSVEQGLDQAMPGTENYFSSKSLLCSAGSLVVHVNDMLLAATSAFILLSVTVWVVVLRRNCTKAARAIRPRSPCHRNSVELAETASPPLGPALNDEEVPEMSLSPPPLCSCASCMLIGAFIIAVIAIALGATGVGGLLPPALEWHSCAAPKLTALNEAVERILSVMYRMDLFNSTKCSPPNCKDWLLKNVTGPAHVSLAREIAAESIVLLKNDGGVLPLAAPLVKKIAIVGSAAAAPAQENLVSNLFARCVPPVSITIVVALALGAIVGYVYCKLTTRASKAAAVVVMVVIGVVACIVIFNVVMGVVATWGFGDYYAGGGSGRVTPLHVVTPLEGIQRRAAAASIEVLQAASDDPEAAIAIAREADVTIIVAATASGEATDRFSLNLDNDANDFIPVVAREARKAVVIMQIPGAVVIPWSSSVAAIAALFLGGQETGSAWADVLFGDTAPAGKLPVMLPLTEADTIPPSSADDVPYTEGLATSYRNPKFQHVYPFGHGLTYTQFTYGQLSSEQCGDATCVKVVVRNTGDVAAKTVPQLYLEFPEVAQQTAPILKGFNKTGLIAPGAETTIVFPLHRRDISYYDPRGDSKGWVAVKFGTVHVGESSADIRQSAPVAFTTDRDSPEVASQRLVV